MSSRRFEIGDVVARDDQVGVVTGAEPYAGLTVLALPGTGARRIWEPDTVRLVMTTDALASLLRTARDADDTGA
jgi:hypothetical protein